MSYLSQTPRSNDVVHPLHREAPAQLNGLDVAFPRTGEGGEEETHREGIVYVTHGVDERGVPGTRSTKARHHLAALNQNLMTHI